MNDRQLPLHLPARAADEILIEKLATIVAEFNETTERVELRREIVRLRALLGTEGTP